eukprot:355642-Heterocapsa_arctica.AAC.1
MSSLSPSISESLCPSLLLFIGLVSRTSLSITVGVSGNLPQWAAWTNIAAVIGHNEHKDDQHDTSDMKA